VAYRTHQVFSSWVTRKRSATYQVHTDTMSSCSHFLSQGQTAACVCVPVIMNRHWGIVRTTFLLLGLWWWGGLGSPQTMNREAPLFNSDIFLANRPHMGGQY
jgi:hypothetical protein